MGINAIWRDNLYFGLGVLINWAVFLQPKLYMTDVDEQQMLQY